MFLYIEVPTMDDGGTLPDPLEHPPDDTEVGADLRAKNQQKLEKKEIKRTTLWLIFLFGVTLLV